MIELEKAIEILLENCMEMKREITVSLIDLDGRILSEDIYAKLDNPPFNRSPLDGYSFNHISSKGADENRPIEIKIVGEICAGDYFEKNIEVGECVRIMTGAMIPENCTCVLRQEDIEEKNGNIIVLKELKLYENFCHRGEDIKFGELILKKGTKLNYTHVGILATMGISQVKVFDIPTVGILSTGDELTDISNELKPGKIYDSNLYVIASRIKNLGMNYKIFGSYGDNPEEVKNIIKENIGDVDLFITTGGVSVGKKDILHEVVNLLEGSKLFWKIKIQPGTPVLASKQEGKILLSLSGNPFAALINLELLGRPILSKISRDKEINYRRETATLRGEFLKKSSNRRMLRGVYSDNKEVRIESNHHSSGEVLSTAGINCIIDIQPGTEKLSNGEKVKVILL